MKQFVLAVLCFLLTNQGNAQDSKIDIFDIPTFNINRSVEVDLGSGRKMKIELTKLSMLNKLDNLDSIINSFLTNIDPLRDSLIGEGDIHYRVDYLLLDDAQNAIRIKNYLPLARQYIIKDGEVAMLKTTQDTISILGKFAVSLPSFKEENIKYEYYRVIFVLNQFKEIEKLKGLNEKIVKVGASFSGSWESSANAKFLSKKFEEISSEGNKGRVGRGEFIYSEISIGLQNYGERILGSTRTSFGVLIKRNRNQHKVGLYADYPLVFSKSYSDSAKSDFGFKNVFIGLEYYFKNVNNKFTMGRSKNLIFPYLTLGYLFRRDGNYFEKNTFQVGVSKFFFLDQAVSVEPMFFINKKYFAPSIKITVPLF